MDLKTQQKISKIMVEQADKLGEALPALRKIRSLENLTHKSPDLMIAINVAKEALKRIADYGKSPEDL